MNVSVITVTFNAVDTIRRTIESVLGQVDVSLEYIIIDGCSTDGTVELLETYRDKLTHLVIEPDSGMYDALNKGLDLASGDIIALLHSDDVFASRNTLYDVITLFKANPGTDVVLCDVIMIEPEQEVPNRKISASAWLPVMLNFGWMPPHPGMFCRREHYCEVGNFSTSYRIAADYEFAVRSFLTHECRYEKLGETAVYMSLGGMSTRGMKSHNIITREIVKAFLENDRKAWPFLLAVRFPLKFVVEVVLFRLLSMFKRY